MTDLEVAAGSPDAPAAPSGRRAAGDIAVQVAGRLGNGVLGIAVMVLVTRALGTEDFGRWSTLLTVIGLAGPLTEVGISQVAIGRAAARPEEEASWLGALLALRLVLAGALGLVSVGAVLALSDGSDMALAGVLLCGTVLLGGLSALTAVFQLRVRNDLLVVTITANSIVWTSAVVLVAALGGGLVALAAGFLGAALVSTTLQVVLGLKRARIDLSGWRVKARELIRVGLPLSLGTVLVIAYGKADQLLVFSLDSERAAGLYGAAYRILDQAIVVPLSVATTLYPLLVRAHVDDPERLRFLLQRALEVLVAVSLGALAFAIPCGGDVLALLFGEEFRPAGPTLAILMAVFGVICLSYLNGSLILIFELGPRMLAISAVGLAVNIGLNLVLIPSHGYVAAAWVTLVTEIVVLGLTTHTTLSRLGWTPDLGRVMRVVLAAAITGGALALLREADVLIEALLVLTPMLYGGLLVGLRGIRVAETLALVRPGSRG